MKHIQALSDEFLEVHFPTTNDDIRFAAKCVALSDELNRDMAAKYGNSQDTSSRYDLYFSVYGNIATTVNYMNNTGMSRLDTTKVYGYLSSKEKNTVYTDIMDIEDEYRSIEKGFTYIELSKLLAVVYNRAMTHIFNM